MIISKYVAEDKIKSVLNSNLKARREECGAIKWGHNWWYPVNALPDVPEVRRVAAESAAYPYSTEEWLTYAEVKKVWPYSRQRFYQLAGNEVQRFRIDIARSPFWVYNKEDIKSYLLHDAVDGRLKNAVEDVDAFIDKVNAW